MRRIEWLKDLVDHFKADVTLADIGQFVFPMSEYRVLNEKNQITPAIWIIPRDARLVNTRNPEFGQDCKTMVEERVLICVAVRNAINTEDHIKHVNGSPSNMYGAYVRASELEDLVRASVLAFNKAVSDDNGIREYQPLRFLDLPEPDEHNGHFVLAQNYSVNFTF